MVPNPDYVYCTICGMDLDEDTVVLAGPHWPTYDSAPLEAQLSSQKIVRYTAEVEYYPGKLLLLPDREQVYPQHPYNSTCQSDEQSNTTSAKMYMGIHAACDDIANRAIKSPFVTVGSIYELWCVLECRCARYLGQLLEQRPQPRDMNYVPPIPYNSPGQPKILGFERYYVPYLCMEQWGDEWEGWWDENPMDIPDLTSSLLANLERLDDNSVETSAEVLPEGLHDYIQDFFHDTKAFPKDNYLLSQPVWKEIFLQIPFLWDLDTQIVHDKTGSDLEEVKKWNWEKLTRQILSSPHPAPANATSYRDEGIWDYAEVGLDAPGRFTNRRRIWQILEDMRGESIVKD
ncbi:uncharacterized protein FSUBG_14064 [Fusarium subglutinans]|uniref:Uncharacterized protein n=1 Tax=Gibberella subglutinans TaxID=42677 RepID=A0A8H5NPP1_GIBSU|nr:uncharacterized protein FSUBG_14064 [Fusarium subglutinans]KAF5574237.1 hypothetical protein FSUBG_14064 [Fusarium subglutinans]